MLQKKIILLVGLLFCEFFQLHAMMKLNRNSFYLLGQTSNASIVELKQLQPRQHNHHQAVQAKPLTLTTTKGMPFPARFFDNNKNRVIVLGQGFFCDSSAMEQFMHLLGPEFDYILFDYRWTNITSFALTPSIYTCPLKKIFYDELEEIQAVHTFLTAHKNYNEIIGLGQCYSSFLFVMAQALYQKENSPFFSRLILDSCWYSLMEFVRNVEKDPWLIANPQKGGPSWIQHLAASYALRGTIKTLTRWLPDFLIKDYASQLKTTPTLFIHGMKDKLISIESFAQLWHSVKAPKSVIFTPHSHAKNMQPDGIMIQACKTFLQTSSIPEFIQAMSLSLK